MAVAIIGVAAAFLMVASSPSSTQAHDGASGSTHCDDLDQFGQLLHDSLNDHTCAEGQVATATPPPTIDPTPEPGETTGTLTSSSDSGGAGVRLELEIDAAGALYAGSSVELYLEDDFQVPDDIDPSDVYFIGMGTGRVYVTDDVEIDDDDHFDPGKDDYSIQVYVPDMNPGNDTGFDMWPASATEGLKLVFTKSAGIKNPTEQGTHSVGYSVLGPDGEANDGPMYSTKNAFEKPDPATDPQMGQGGNKMVYFAMHGGVETNAADVGLKTVAKISLSDEDAGRGKEITVTGTGFNNGTNAEVRVLIDKSGTAPSCMDIMTMGEKLGAAEVGSDDKFVVTFTVHQDDFDPGAVNYICAADSEAGTGAQRPASAVKVFDLEPSVTVSPASVSFGDEVTLKPRDFTAAVSEIAFGTSHVWKLSEANGSLTGCDDDYEAGEERDPPTDRSIIVCIKEKDGSDYVFDLPGGLDERIQIAVKDGVDTKRIYMGVVASSLTLSKSEVAPNESIVISGSGFNNGVKILVSEITIDGKMLDVDDAGTEGSGSGRYVTTTSNGTFTVTARVWAKGDSNPALDDDTYTIKVVDEEDFEGEADITIKEPTIMVSPDTASPRDFIVISGTNWPVTTADLDNEVDIIIHRGETYERRRSANVDGNGRFRYEYQLPAGVRIGDDQKVQVRFDGDGGDIEEDTTFAVTEAELGITPAAAAPGQMISVEIEGMPPYTLVEHVRIDGANRIGGRNVNTDREGNAVVADILVPFLDPGFYPVEVKVGDETRVAQLEVLAEALVPAWPPCCPTPSPTWATTWTPSSTSTTPTRNGPSTTRAPSSPT